MRKVDPRILLTGSYGHGNIGDEAILGAIVSQLRARIPDVRLVVVAGDTDGIRTQFGVEVVSWADWAAIAQAMQTSDLVIQGGGGIFFDYTGFHPWNLFENGAPGLNHHGGHSLLAALYDKPFMTYGVGVGPLVTESGRQMVRVAHALAGRITVRDAESRSLLEELGVESNRIEVTADPAFALQPANTSRAREILSQHGIDLERPTIAVTTRPWSSTEGDWESALANAVSELATSKVAQVLLIPFHKGHDDASISRIQQQLTLSKTFVLRSEYSPQEIAGVIGACDLMVGLRLHSVLFAILASTPAVGLAYDPKVRSLMRRIGHEDLCVDLNDTSRLNEVFVSAWQRREKLSRDFEHARQKMIALSERNADAACELLTGGATERFPGLELRKVLADALYGRLQAVRVRDYVISKQERTDELQEVAAIMRAERVSETSEPDDWTGLGRLRAFLSVAVTESTKHLVLIYDNGKQSDETSSLADTLVDSGIPTVLISDRSNPFSSDSLLQHVRILHLPVAAMLFSFDEALRIMTSPSCSQILLLRSADRNTFRLINHAHALDWTTIYFPDSQQGRDLEAEKYVVNNVEHTIIPGEEDSDQVLFTNSQRPKDCVAKILALAAESPKSVVRMAIGGAGRG